MHEGKGVALGGEATEQARDATDRAPRLRLSCSEFVALFAAVTVLVMFIVIGLATVLALCRTARL